MKLNLILIGLCIAITAFFLLYTLRYPKRSSFSSYAYPLQQDGKVFLFYVFICLGICFTLGWVAQNSVTTVASAFLGIIGIYTGYNPEIKGKRWEDAIHVICVDVAIGLYVVGIIIKYVKFGYPWHTLMMVPFLGLSLFFLLYKKMPRRTYWIELVILAMAVYMLAYFQFLEKGNE